VSSQHILAILNNVYCPLNTCGWISCWNKNIEGLWFRCLTPLSTIFSVISLRSVLLVDENGAPGENHRPVASPDKLCHTMLYRVHTSMSGIRTHHVSGDICTGCIVNYKSYYNTMTTTTVPWKSRRILFQRSV